MKTAQPFIGITCDVQIPRRGRRAYELVCDHRYPAAIRAAGGYPVLLPISRRPEIVRFYLRGIDGLVIVGGDDVDPRLYGEEPKPDTGRVFPLRLRFETKLYGGARRIGLPVLGICYGMQLINVLEGGSLHQDIRRDAGSPRDHRDPDRPRHRIRIAPGTRLHRILGRDSILAHSDHHQAVARLAAAFHPAAHAPDGIVEAIEGPDERVLAVQWHPERGMRSDATRRLFRSFVRLCRG